MLKTTTTTLPRGDLRPFNEVVFNPCLTRVDSRDPELENSPKDPELDDHEQDPEVPAPPTPHPGPPQPGDPIGTPPSPGDPPPQPPLPGGPGPVEPDIHEPLVF
jgi:hypothetical protein